MSKIDVVRNEFCKETIALEAKARLLYLEMGARLHKIREEKLYEPYWDSWVEYCMEFKDMSPSAISKMISVYETFVLRWGFSYDRLSKVGGWTKLYALTNIVSTKKEAEHWLSKSQDLTLIDLSREVREVKTGVSMHKCKHPNKYTITVCPDCKDRWGEDGKKKD
jgi:hypothetical protein